MKIAISGGGIAGLTTAIALNQKGFDVVVYESAPAIKVVGAGISLAANAIKALDRLGLKKSVAAKGHFLSSFSVLNEKGNILTSSDSKQLSGIFGDDNFAIKRADLHEVLLSFLKPNQLKLGKKIVDIVQDENSVRLFFEDGTQETVSCLVAADGIHSVARKKYINKDATRYAGYTCWRGLVQHAGVKPVGASETWGANGRFGIVPLPNDFIYWFACVNAKKQHNGFSNFSLSDLQNQFKNYHQPIPTILSKTQQENVIWGDIIDHKPINQYAFGKVLLIGDAAHATTPNLGQGACQGIEDAIVLANEWTTNIEVERVFKQFELRRIERTHFIVNKSWQVGKLAQLENPILIAMRNAVMRNTPASVNQRQFEKLYEVDF